MDILPLIHSPVEVTASEGEALVLHLLGEHGLLCRAPAGEVELILQGVLQKRNLKSRKRKKSFREKPHLDTANGDVGQPGDFLLEFSGTRHRVADHEPLHLDHCEERDPLGRPSPNLPLWSLNKKEIFKNQKS